MGEKNNDQSIMDKSMRSVFGELNFHCNSMLRIPQWFGAIKTMVSIFFSSFLVGNIPYEATEEKLKEIFSEVGPVLSLK